VSIGFLMGMYAVDMLYMFVNGMNELICVDEFIILFIF
jgi:hypothetical protein